MTRYPLPVLALAALCLWTSSARALDNQPPMKFNEVREVAPGVFFRYSAISATDLSVQFGGSNNIWVVFDDYVVVIDANFPQGAAEVIAAIKKTTDKPIRYVLDSHHHGDHAYGNAVFAAAGATVVAQTNCARLLRVDGPREFREAGRGPTGRKDVAESTLKVPNLIFDDKMVLDDGKHRLEFYFLGHAHTAGDAFAYLPHEKILCTGDACVNGAFNYLGHADTASWIKVMERAQQLDVQFVLPGHGPIAAKEVLEKQKHYFVDLRAQVGKAVAENKSIADVISSIDMPWYKEWTGVKPTGDNIRYVYAELTGRTKPYDFLEDFGLTEGASPTKSSPGWTKPHRIVVPNLMPARLAELKRVAPDVEFVPVHTAEEAATAAADADAVVGFCTAAIVKAAPKLRWIHNNHAGIDQDWSPELAQAPLVLTNMQRLHGPNSADQGFALLLALTRGLHPPTPAGGTEGWTGANKRSDSIVELNGKTMLVVGLGGIGTQVAKRAHAFGMRVRAIDPKVTERPDYVFSLDKPERLMELLPESDVVVLACPLTPETTGLISAKQLQAMKRSAYVINIGRGKLVTTEDLTQALKQKTIAGAGLDVVDPEPLPASHELWSVPQVVISPRVGGQSAAAADRQWRLLRENVRRFVEGEQLLGVVDKSKGY
jgi:phosphoglycerate dehydrogenase-like enzyme/glyoxylase-like metal-dependent hydrolase (beta-lactamase superfamily II)